MLGRVLAGIGAGLVIRSAPRILPAGQEGRIAWAGIVLPAAGPVVIALAVEWSPWWSWQGGFLFEVVLALLSLALVLSIADPPDARPGFPSGAGRTAGLLSRGRCGRTCGLVRDALGPAPRLARGAGHH